MRFPKSGGQHNAGPLTTNPALRVAGMFPVLLVALGLALLQALIGGRVLLFAFPGYCLIGAAGLTALVFAPRARTQADALCLYGTAIFVGYILVRALASPGYFARADLLSALGALVVYGVTVTTLTSANARAKVIGALLIFALVHVFIGLIQFSRGDNFMLIPFLQRADYGQRASGFYVCPNHLAGLLEVVGIFGLSLVCWGRWPIWGKLLAGYSTAACYVGIALTGSRGGYLSVMASLLVFAALSVMIVRSARPQNWLKFGALSLIGLLFCGLVAAVLIRQSGYLSERAGNIVDTQNMRVDLWRAALQQWQLQPVVGTGSGTYRFYGRQFRAQHMQNDPIDVHNDYLHLLCEYGLIGAVAFLLFFSAHVRQGWRNLKSLSHRASGNALSSNRLALAIGALSAISAYVVHSIFDFNLHVPANAMLLAFVFGMVANAEVSPNFSGPRMALTTVPRIATGAFSLVLVIACLRFFRGEYYVEKARTALRDENPTESITFANKALEHERLNPGIFFYLGRALIASGNQSDTENERTARFERAITSFREAHRLAPLDGTYPLDLAFAFDEMGHFAEAEQMYELARSRDPHSSAISELYRAHLQSWEKTGSSKKNPL